MQVEAEIASLASRIGLTEEQRREVTDLVRWLWRGPSGGVSSLGGETVFPDDAGGPSRANQSVQLPARYEDSGPIGAGGMGEVRRVHDRELARTVAMKLIRSDLLGHPAAVARFVEEAQVCAQLEHPGIVPVHEIGQLPDGRLYFTMKEVRGETLSEVIRDVHGAGRPGWTLRRLVDAFVKVAEAVGYAHARGVVHRDLKPANVMIGAHGEVLVLDWGLAKVLTRPGADEPIVSLRAIQGAEATRLGAVAGTAAYMAPEQARGENDRLDARADVFALGAILVEILGGDRLADAGRTDPAQLPGAPAELAALCVRALSALPGDRPAHGAEVADEARAWLEGSRRREQALAVLAEAEATIPAAQSLRARAEALRTQAAALLGGIEPWESEERKAPGWALEDEAARLDREASLLSLRHEALLRASLTHAPDLEEAHAALAARYRNEHAGAEEARDDALTARAERRMREHFEALPQANAERVRCATWLRGDGAVSLMTDPEGAEVELHRFTLRNRRLVPVRERDLGRTPIRAAPLPMGSYLLVMRHPECLPVRYPVVIARGQHWDGLPPEPGASPVVPLPRPGDLGPFDQYVPRGWFWCGDPKNNDGLPRRWLWCEGLVGRRFSVTNAEYIAFLDALVVSGREADALVHAPRERGGTVGEEGPLIYGRHPDGRFFLRPDADGDLWEAPWPVGMVNWAGALAYCEWLARVEGHPWRLPGELEWEKAAAGVDGRLFPWGDGFDPSWACLRDSFAKERPLPRPVDSFPVDESVYGLRGMAGNSQQWCGESRYDARAGPPLDGVRVVPPVPPDRVDLSPSSRRPFRGAAWSGAASGARCAYRYGFVPSDRFANLGLRPFRSWPALP